MIFTVVSNILMVVIGLVVSKPLITRAISIVHTVADMT